LLSAGVLLDNDDYIEPAVRRHLWSRDHHHPQHDPGHGQVPRDVGCSQVRAARASFFPFLQEIACKNIPKGRNFTRKFTNVDFYLSLLRKSKNFLAACETKRQL
jgi:hypothetical protein